jgi:hypothetical protein
MSSDIQALRRSSTTAVAQATAKRVRQSIPLHQFGCWWDLRYPTRAK